MPPAQGAGAAFEGRVCGADAPPPRVVRAAGTPASMAVVLGDTIWLRPVPVVEAQAASPQVRIDALLPAAGRARIEVAMQTPDCGARHGMLEVPLVEGPTEGNIDRAVAASSSVLRAARARAAGDLLGARATLQEARLPPPPPPTARWAALQAARVALDLGFVDEASELLRETDGIAVPVGLAAFAAALRVRIHTLTGPIQDALQSRQALDEQLRPLLGDQHEDVVANEVYRASAEQFGGLSAEAARRLAANATGLHRLAPTDPVRVDAAIVQASLARREGRDDDAERVLREALDAAGDAEFPRMQLTRFFAGAIATTRPMEALPAMRRVAAWYAGHLGATSVLTVYAEANLASLYAHLGRFTEAIALQRRTVGAFRARFGADDLRALVAEHALASVLSKALRWDEAAALLRSTLPRADAHGDGALAQRVHMRLDLVAAEWERDGPGVACAVVDDAVALAERAASLTAELRQVVGMSQAQCDVVRGAASRGLASLAQLREDAIARYGASSRPAILARSALARALMTTGRTGEARAELEAMAAALERLRREDVGEAAGGRGAFAEWLDGDRLYAGYRDLGWLYLLEGRVADAVRVAEATRARRVRDTLDLQATRRRLDAPAALRADALEARMRALEAETALLPASALARAPLDAERTQLARELDALVAGAVPAAPPDDLDALRRGLPSGTAYVGVQMGDGWAWAFVVRRDRPIVAVPLRRLPALVPALGALLAQLATPPGVPVRLWQTPEGGVERGLAAPSPGAVPLDPGALLQALGDALLQPLASSLGGIRALALAADAPLSALPFDVLRVNGAPVAARYAVTLAPSLATRHALAHRPPARADHDLFALGAPNYVALRPDPGDASGAAARTWAPLPAADDEVRAVRAAFPSARTAVLTGDDATVDAVLAASRDGTLRRSRFVHVAAHALLDADEPARSALVLAGPGGHLAALPAAQVATLAIGADLVVLSACDTARGRETPGEGLFGLPYALIAAGTRGAVLTLWPVADEATAAFMRRFYAKLGRGNTPAAALAQTKREFMRDGRWGHPFFWAAFVLYGSG